MFEELSSTIREDVVLTLFHAQVTIEAAQQLQPVEEPNGNLQYAHETAAGADAIAAAGAGAGATATAVAPARAAQTQGTVVNDEHQNVGRNDPCWCGSGKKFKRCHGA